jgi:hypothetical protein
MTIRLDRSAASVLVICDCGYRELCTSTMIAHRIAGEHERAAHAGCYTARAAHRMYITRHMVL